MALRFLNDHGRWALLLSLSLALCAGLRGQCALVDSLYLGCEQLDQLAELPTELIIQGTCEGTTFSLPQDRLVREAVNSCSDTTIYLRTFTVTDEAGNSYSDSVWLLFLRPDIDAVMSVPTVLFNQCVDPTVIEYPEPRAEDYPFLATPSGPVHLTAAACRYQVTYSDGPPIPGCENNYAFVRNYYSLDWCQGGKVRSFTQLVQVADREGPIIVAPTQDRDFDGVADEGPLVFTTNRACSALIDTRANVGISDACSSQTELFAYVFVDAGLEGTPLGPYDVLGGDLIAAITDPVPVGRHILRYVGRDGCGNESMIEVLFDVVDDTAPVAICAENLAVTLDANGEANLSAATLGGGSFDNCGPFDLQIANARPDGSPLGDFSSNVTVDCAAAGETTVVLVAIDTLGRENRCWTQVSVEDNVPPRCLAPDAATISCVEYNNNFPQNPDAFGDLLPLYFGSATGIDNCGESITSETYTVNVSDCGVGTIERSFVSSDGAGLTQTSACVQLVSIIAIHDYTVTFPADGRYDCGEVPGIQDLPRTSLGCDLVSIDPKRDTLQGVGSGCYRYVTTYDVVNWCEYDRQSPFLDLKAETGIEQTTEAMLLSVAEGTARFGSTSINAYGQPGRTGAFRYRHQIDVVDDSAPSLSVEQPDAGIAFTGDCLGGILFEVAAADNCIVPELLVAIDLDGNSAEDFRSDVTVSSARQIGLGGDAFEISATNLPIGRHLARVSATDECGNLSSYRFVPIEIIDGKAPTPSCVNTLAVTLSPDPELGGVGSLLADDLIASPPEICTPVEVQYSVYRETAVNISSFSPKPGDTHLALNCTDLGNSVAVRLYGFSPDGNNDYCMASVRVIANDEAICADRQGIIAGHLFTRGGEPVPGVEITNIFGSQQIISSDETGYFEFDNLMEGEDYTIVPYLDEDHDKGISTLDFVLINQYLLNGRTADWTPYQFIAADANRSGAVTVQDLFHLRRILLNLDSDFDNNTSWRFVPEDYDFPVPDDPWSERFPEVINYNNLSGYQTGDFVAIKVGDVSGNANPNMPGNQPEGEGGRNAKLLDLIVAEVEGQPDYFGLYLPTDQPIVGLQFSLLFAEEAYARTVRPSSVKANEMRIDRDGRLHVSYLPAAPPNSPLLLFPKEVWPGVSLGDDRHSLIAEAYTEDLSVLQPQLVEAWQDGVAIAATVYPNPIVNRATVSLDWDAHETVDCALHTNDGRLIKRWSQALVSGKNRFELDAQALAPTSGVITLTINGREDKIDLRLIKN